VTEPVQGRDEAGRRQQALLGAFAGVVVVIAAIVGLAVAGSDDDTTTTQAAAEPAASAQAPGAANSAAPTPAQTAPAQTAPAQTAPAQGATRPGFPPLPEGADPALATRPTTTAGPGELTKLTVKSLVKGKGTAARAGQGITVNYVGVLYQTGEEFDASWNRSEPFTFQLGVGDVIPGFDQGLIGVTVGSRVQLDIPAELAYGDNPAGGRPAGPLRFIVDVLAVQ
jgi:FKBP-type peptidyl-prolyl cis-trans isomerase